MALNYTCDGCDKTLEKGVEMHERGYVVRKQYCGCCINAVDGYLSEIREVQKKAAASVEAEVASLREKFKCENLNAGLPDEI